jgi:hypothetical protein
MRKIVAVVVMLVCQIAASAAAEDIAGDWIGQLNAGFRVRVHIERIDSGFTCKLINPSGNETVLDQVTSDGIHFHFAVKKLNLSYEGVWSEQDKLWNGKLTFQQVYSLSLHRATAADLAPAVHKRPQEDAINASPTP